MSSDNPEFWNIIETCLRAMNKNEPAPVTSSALDAMRLERDTALSELRESEQRRMIQSVNLNNDLVRLEDQKAALFDEIEELRNSCAGFAERNALLLKSLQLVNTQKIAAQDSFEDARDSAASASGYTESLSLRVAVLESELREAQMYAKDLEAELLNLTNDEDNQ